MNELTVVSEGRKIRLTTESGNAIVEDMNDIGILVTEKFVILSSGGCFTTPINTLKRIEDLQKKLITFGWKSTNDEISALIPLYEAERDYFIKELLEYLSVYDAVYVGIEVSSNVSRDTIGIYRTDVIGLGKYRTVVIRLERYDIAGNASGTIPTQASMAQDIVNAVDGVVVEITDRCSACSEFLQNISYSTNKYCLRCNKVVNPSFNKAMNILYKGRTEADVTIKVKKNFLKKLWKIFIDDTWKRH